MPEPTVFQFRPSRARVAVAYSTKDRVDLTRLTVAKLLDDPALDLYWFDGSATEAGQKLPHELCSDRVAICELHQDVVGGPDCAIMYALKTLRAKSYDYVILVESDVLLTDGWLAAMSEAISRSEAAGFQVGAATVRVYDRRVLSFNDTYCLMLNSGAGFIALTPAAIDIVLANYRTLDGAEFISRFKELTNRDVSATAEVFPDARLSVDYIFDLALYMNGLVVVAPPISFARMVDDITLQNIKLVTWIDDHLPELHSLITRPDQLRKPKSPFSRFQKSLKSDRLWIGCHQLQLGLNRPETSQPVLLEGQWTRRWAQMFGPFVMSGNGIIRFSFHKSTVGVLLATKSDESEIRLLSPDGTQLQTAVLPRDIFLDIPFTAEDDQTHEIILHVASGEIAFLGLTTDAAVAARYANDHTTIDHLLS